MDPLVGHVINLDNRPERWETIQERFKGSKMVKLSRFSATKANTKITPKMGCFISHQRIVQTAKIYHMPYVLLLEDDATVIGPIEEFDQRLTEILQWLTNHKTEWDIFMGGIYKFYTLKLLDAPTGICESKGLMTHFCIISANAYDKILSANVERVPVDLFYFFNLRQLTAYPMLSYQTNNYSDVLDKYVNRKNEYQLCNGPAMDYLSFLNTEIDTDHWDKVSKSIGYSPEAGRILFLSNVFFEGPAEFRRVAWHFNRLYKDKTWMSYEILPESLKSHTTVYRGSLVPPEGPNIVLFILDLNDLVGVPPYVKKVLVSKDLVIPELSCEVIRY